MARKDFAEEGDTPLLQRFGQKGVVGVGEGPGNDGPSLFPRKVVVIDQEALQFGDTDRGMRVVQLDGNLFRELGPVSVVFLEPADDVPQGASGEKVLLKEAELFAGLGVIVRVKDFADRLGHVFLADGLFVTTAVEGVQVEVFGGF